jgi:amino acid permease
VSDLRPINNFRYAVCTAAILSLSLVIALSVNDLGIVLAIVGSTGSAAVTFIPGLFYYNMHPEHAEGTDSTSMQLLLRKLSRLLYMIGVFLVLICLFAIFMYYNVDDEL